MHRRSVLADPEFMAFAMAQAKTMSIDNPMAASAFEFCLYGPLSRLGRGNRIYPMRANWHQEIDHFFAEICWASSSRRPDFCMSL